MAVAVPRVPRSLVGTILLGTLLNPLNSSMIAVALVRLRDDFAVTLATASWLVSAFYLGAALGALATGGRVAAAWGPGPAGVLVPLAGGRAIFSVTPAPALVGLPLALRFLPADPGAAVTPRAVLTTLDWPGVALFAGTLA